MKALYDLYQVKVGSAKFLNFNYIVVDKATRQAAIVDPAWEEARIIAMLSRLDVKPNVILLTHSHHDHVNLVDRLVERFDSQVYMSAEEIAFYHFTCNNLHPVHHAEEMRLGQTPILCLLTPGHTAGGMCYLVAESLFTGDTVFTEGCGICTTSGGSPEQLFESIQLLKRVIEPHVRVYPGHSFGKEPGQTMQFLFQENIYFQIEVKEDFVQFRMRANQSNLFDFQ